MAKRIYIVRNDFDMRSDKPRLIRAHSQAQAIRHVAKDYQATVASQDDLVSSLTSGVKVEDAGADTEDKTSDKPATEPEGGAPD
jgi:hypothetical protein